MPFVNYAIIAANVVAFVFEWTTIGGGVREQTLLATYGLVPARLWVDPIGALETVFTSMFMHASIVQILGNVLFLWIFGSTLEDTIGPIKYLGFYILGGLATLGLEVAMAPNSMAPTVGAAGPIAAVLGGYVLLYPRARVFSLSIIPFFVTVIAVPVFVMLAIWFVMQAIFVVANLTNPSGSGGGVAYLAQVLAFAFGLLVVKGLATRRKSVPPPHPVY